MDKRVPKPQRAVIQELEAQGKEIRGQLGEQLRALEQRTEAQAALLQELQDFFKRKADVEADYGRALDKLAKNVASRARSERQRRDAWPQHSMQALWEQLVDETRAESRMHAGLSDVYANYATAQLAQRADALHRVARRCRELGAAAHEEIARVLNELITSMKTYHLCSAECGAVEAKFRATESVKAKFEEAHPEKTGSRKYRIIEKDYNKRHGKYQEYKVRALRARNEYLLCVEAANAALHQYFADDVSDLLDCSDLGLQHWLAHLVGVLVSARKTVCQHDMDALAELSGLSDNFDSRLDKRRFLEAHHVTFSLPKRFDFRPAADDHVRQVSAQHAVQDDLVQRLWQIQKRLADLRAEHDEVWKTLVSTEKRVLDLQTQPAVDVDALFDEPTAQAQAQQADAKCAARSCKEPEVAVQKRRQDLTELEDFYIEKFHQYLLHANLMKRLQARNDSLRRALDARPTPQAADNNGDMATTAPHTPASAQSSAAPHDDRLAPARKRSAVVVGTKRPGSLSVGNAVCKDRRSSSADEPATPATPSDACTMEAELALAARPPVLPPKPRKRVVTATGGVGGRPKLFGGTVDEYAEATGEPVPLLIVSCVRMLAAFGLHHQGVFRVSGSQLEIGRFKDSFEKGVDPLVSGAVDAGDVNSVAGVLKLYFRELREPLFPVYMFSQFIECAKIGDRAAFLVEISSLVRCLSLPVVVVLRYLFAFLNHLAEYSDENMMDPYNLAICFGPTLLPIPDDKDQVFYHNYVNELVKSMIIYHEKIFDQELPGPLYERFPLCVNADVEPGEEIECEPSPAAGLLSASEPDSRSAGGSVDHRTTSSSSAAAGEQLRDATLVPQQQHQIHDAVELSPLLSTSAIGANVVTRDHEEVYRPQAYVVPPSPSSKMSSMARARLNPVDMPPAPNKSPLCITTGASGLLKLRPYTSVAEPPTGQVAYRTHRKLASEPPPGMYDDDYYDEEEDEDQCNCNGSTNKERTPHRVHEPPHAVVDVRDGGKDHSHLSVAESEADGRLSAASLGAASSCAPAVSPSSLREIQTELKAVLNSLEMFNINQQCSPLAAGTTTGAAAGHNNNVDGYGKAEPTAVATGGTTTGTPDLVQNLPAACRRASPQKSVDSCTPTADACGDTAAGTPVARCAPPAKSSLLRHPQPPLAPPPPPPAVKPKPNLSLSRGATAVVGGGGATVAPMADGRSPAGGHQHHQHHHPAIDRVALSKDARLSPVLTVVEENL